jgi:hypothetical protein
MELHTRKRKSRTENTSLNKRQNGAYERSGKWSRDEERFANQLVLEFENGTLQDCADGMTLRAYLSKKLNCAPMRISKKFAGRCIGKLIFQKSDLWIEAQSERLCQLENQYRSSCSKSSGYYGMEYPNKPYDSGSGATDSPDSEREDSSSDDTTAIKSEMGPTGSMYSSAQANLHSLHTPFHAPLQPPRNWSLGSVVSLFKFSCESLLSLDPTGVSGSKPPSASSGGLDPNEEWGNTYDTSLDAPSDEPFMSSSYSFS